MGLFLKELWDTAEKKHSHLKNGLIKEERTVFFYLPKERLPCKKNKAE